MMGYIHYPMASSVMGSVMESDPIQSAGCGIHRVTLSFAVIALCSTGKAGAADMAASPAPAYSWTGCNAALNAGEIAGADQNSFSIGGGFLQDNNLFTQSCNQERVANSFGMHAQGFTAADQIECNKQIGMLVFGVEANIDRALRLGATIDFGPAERETAV
jgi:hypothetical protein